MDGYKDSETDRHRWMDTWMDGWMDGRMDGWMDIKIVKQTDIDG